MELTKRDGISYPNRILRQVVTRLPVQQYKFEYHSDWTNGRFYDCYFVFQNKEYVIEMDGKQHYKDSKWTTYEYQKEIDEYKNNLAESNNVQMIRIDCSISQFYYIKKSMNNSLLGDLFDLSVLDWGDIRIRSLGNTIIEVCNYFSSHPEKTTREIANDLMLNRTTVLNYLKEGAACGICNYSVPNAKKQGTEKRIKNRSRNNNTLRVKLYDQERNLLGCFDSARQAYLYLSNNSNKDIKYAGLAAALRYSRPYKGYFIEPDNLREFAKNVIKDYDHEVFDYYHENNYPSVAKVASHFGISIAKARVILARGKTYGYCNFDSWKSLESDFKGKRENTQKVRNYGFYYFRVYKDGSLFGEYHMLKDFLRSIKDNPLDCKMGERKAIELYNDNSKTYKGFRFEKIQKGA